MNFLNNNNMSMSINENVKKINSHIFQNIIFTHIKEIIHSFGLKHKVGFLQLPREQLKKKRSEALV